MTTTTEKLIQTAAIVHTALTDPAFAKDDKGAIEFLRRSTTKEDTTALLSVLGCGHGDSLQAMILDSMIGSMIGGFPVKQRDRLWLADQLIQRAKSRLDAQCEAAPIKVLP